MKQKIIFLISFIFLLALFSLSPSFVLADVPPVYYDHTPAAPVYYNHNPAPAIVYNHQNYSPSPIVYVSYNTTQYQPNNYYNHVNVSPVVYDQGTVVHYQFESTKKIDQHTQIGYNINNHKYRHQNIFQVFFERIF
jgi:hypothetical protein